jgi:hypothetical protein
VSRGREEDCKMERCHPGDAPSLRVGLALDSEDECERQARIALVRELDPAAQDGRAPSDSGSAVATGLRARACAKASASQNGY